MKCPRCTNKTNFKAAAWKLVHEFIFFTAAKASRADIYDDDDEEIVDSGIFSKEDMKCLKCGFKGTPVDFFQNGFGYEELPLNAHNCPRNVLLSIELRLKKRKYTDKEQLKWIRNIVNRQLNGSEFPAKVRVRSRSAVLAKPSLPSNVQGFGRGN
jgi:hypothetical protein